MDPEALRRGGRRLEQHVRAQQALNALAVDDRTESTWEAGTRCESGLA